MSVFSSLNFNFDTSKFGSSLYLSPQAEAYLNAAPLQISTWQKDDLSAGNVQMTNYYKNPATTVCTNLTSNATSILSWTAFSDTSNTFPYAAEAAERYKANLNSLLIEIPLFKSHTDNVSGVSTMTSNTDTVPSLDMALNIGNQLLRIVNATDEVSNTVPLLGNMTCLYIIDDLVANNTQIQADYNIIVSQYNVSNSNCTISMTDMDYYNSRINTLTNYMSERRLADFAFYARSVNIMTDYQKLSTFNTMGNTQTTLVNTLIGTDRLKNNLANTA